MSWCGEERGRTPLAAAASCFWGLNTPAQDSNERAMQRSRPPTRPDLKRMGSRGACASSCACVPTEGCWLLLLLRGALRPSKSGQGDGGGGGGVPARRLRLRLPASLLEAGPSWNVGLISITLGLEIGTNSLLLVKPDYLLWPSTKRPSVLPAVQPIATDAVALFFFCTNGRQKV